MFVEPEHSWHDDLIDPALEDGLRDLQARWSRLRADPGPEWSVAALLSLRAPLRQARSSGAFLDEASMKLTAMRLPERSLEPLPESAPLLSRLRMLHARLLPVRYPVAADWYEMGGRPAVLDRFARAAGGSISGFSLATELAPDLGMVVLGSAPPDRDTALHQVGIPLASLARVVDDGLAWTVPSAWWVTEELQLTTETLQAFVRFEPLAPGTGLEEWTEEVFARAPFLRDFRRLGDRAVSVRGLEEARLQRFDWQPSARDRVLTTVVTGITGGHGFSYVLDVPLQAAGPLVDPDSILASVEVRPLQDA
jgi:hypothetical protein